MNMRKLSWKQPAAQDEEAEAEDGLTRLLKDTQANFRRVSDALKQLPDAGGERASTTEDTAGASGPTPWKKLAEMARSGKDGKRNRLGCLAGFKVHGW